MKRFSFPIMGLWTSAMGAGITLLALNVASLSPAQTTLSHDAAGNRASQAAVTTPGPLLLRVPPLTQLAAQGGAARFSVLAGGTGPFAYQWLRDGVPIPDATADVLAFANTLAADFTSGPGGTPKYAVRVTNAFSSITSNAVELYKDSLRQGLPDWWRAQFFGSALAEVNPAGDLDGDGVSNLQEYRDGTAPDSAASRFGRLVITGPNGLVSPFPLQDTYAPGTPVSVRGESIGDLQFGGWTGSLRSPSSDFSFDFSAGGDHFLSGLFGAMPVEETTAPPFFAGLGAAPASIRSLATAPDGSAVVCGTFEQLNHLPRRYVARLYANGLPDTNFVPAVNGPVTAAAVQPDRKVIIVGSFTQVNGTAQPGVARLLATGALDPAFTPASQGANVPQISHVALQRDGKILASGSIWNGSAFQPLARFLPGGGLDPAFAPALDSAPTALALQGDGKIVLGGAFTQVNATSVPKLVRLRTDGTLDPAFSASMTDGVATPPVTIVVQPDGKILAGGAVQIRLNTSNVTLPVIRLLADGTLDTAFTQRITALTPAPVFRAVTLQDDGRIVGVGSFTLTKPDVVNAVRLKPDGSVDPDAFVISRANGPINAVLAQSDRSLILGGEFVTVTPREGPMNHHRYLLTASRKTWHAAEAEAQAVGGHLAAINGRQTQEFLTNTMLPAAGLANFPAWIGLSDHGVEGQFAWSSGDPTIFTNWHPGNPDNFNGVEDYVTINWHNAAIGATPGTWNDNPNPGVDFGGNSGGPYYGVIEVNPDALVVPSTAWVAGRDLARNERAGAVTELTNPNATVPEWSYGFRSTRTSATNELTLFLPSDHTNSAHLAGTEGWVRAPFTTVAVNPGSIGIAAPTGVIRPEELLLHPAPGGYTVVRWTAPVAGSYAVTAFWQHIHSNSISDGMNASIVRNGTNLVFNLDYDNNHGPSTNHILTLAAGETLDFLLGVRGNDFADSSRFNAVIKRIPNASTGVWISGRDLTANEKPDGGAEETQNPNPTVPAWSYGSRSGVVSSGFSRFTPAQHINSGTGGGPDDELEGWSTSTYALAVNTGTTPITYNYGFGPNLPFYPGEILLAPASGGNPSPVVRWTAPSAGNYDVFAWWQDSDFHGGNGFSAHIVVNGGQVYGQDIDNAHGASTFQTLTLAAGDVVDFTMGTRGGFDFDVTKFNAAIFGPGTPVVSPPTVLTPITARLALAGNATIDWATVGANNAQLPNPFGVTASNGAAFRVSKTSEGPFRRLNQGAGWFGNFAPGDAVLNHADSDGPVFITAAEAGGVFSALGAQIMPNQDGPFTATLRAFDGNGTLLGTATFSGTGNNSADNSAIFVGVRSDSENIHSVSIDTNTTGFGGDLALNHVSLVSTPSANGDLALSRGGFARVVTTNLLTTGELAYNPVGPIFAAGASVEMLLAPQTTDAPLLTVRLERTGDGYFYQDAGQLTPAGGGTWTSNTVLPPGTSHYRAVVTDGRQQQRRSFAAGPFVTPPAVTSELTANAQVGVAFQYAAGATGPLTGFTVSDLPAWATAAYDPASEILTITGTPTAPGLSTITLTPANAAGTTSATLALLVSDTFESWRTGEFTAAELNDPALSGPNGDATGSGFDNLLRYALGVPPKRAGREGYPADTPQTINGLEYLAITYTRDLSASGVTLTEQITENLESDNWKSGAGYTTEISRVNNGNGTETVVTRASLPTNTGSGHRYMRLRATK